MASSASNLGTAYIKIQPQMDGIQSAITKGLQGAVKSSTTATASAVGTVVSSAVSTAVRAVTNSLDGAISRVDTLNTFPKIMKNLGFSAEESTASVKKLSDRIEGLPTTLDEIVTYTQRLASSTGNLNKGVKNATSIAIAFNDAALAGGKGQIEANRAFEQFVQIVSRGRPSMQDWKIMMEVMPGQLKQMAKYMGENNDSLKAYAKQAGKTVDQLDGMDLYEWISADKNEHAKERLAQFTDALVTLDEKGGSGIVSFKDQVNDATQTIGTALRLIPVRITKALATVVQAFGANDIYDAVDNFTKSFAGIGDWIAKNIVPIIKNEVVPAIKTVLEAIKNVVSFIAENKWVQDFLMNTLKAMLAFKALKSVTGTITSFIKPIGDIIKNSTTAISTFKKARDAGLTFGTAMGAASSETEGLVSSLTGVASKATEAHGKFSIFNSTIGKTALGIGAATLAITGLQMVITEVQTEEIEAETKARDYARTHYTLRDAAEDASKSLEKQKAAVKDLTVAEDAANNAEIRSIEARKEQARYQEEMNKLKKEGKEKTDDYRLAELKYKQAVLEESEANKKLKQSTQEVADLKEEIEGFNASSIINTNLAIGNIMKEAGEYGNLAKQMDNLSNSTITYKNAQGEMVRVTDEKSKSMVDALAQRLAEGNETWGRIVDLARTEGISFSEACAKYGKEGGDGLVGNFSTSVKYNIPLATEASKSAMTEVINKTRSVAKNGGYEVGKYMTDGMAEGILNSLAIAKVVNNSIFAVGKAIAAQKKAADEHSPSKKTAEIGKFMSLGLAKGIDDYADEAVSSAKNMVKDTINALDRKAVLDLGTTGTQTQLQPQTDLTSGMNGSQSNVVQYNTFNQVDTNLDVKEISKRLGWQVATAL